MASDRIGKKSANLVAVPPFERVSVSTNHLLEQEVVAKNIRNVPVNMKLVDSIYKEGIHNPLLLMANWYPLAGSQRVRAALYIKENIDENWNEPIKVHRFLDDYHNVFYLWGDEGFRSKAIAIWFQLQELVFKSLYYEHDADKRGTKMTVYEDIGEELEWEHDRVNSRTSSDSDTDNTMEHVDESN